MDRHPEKRSLRHAGRPGIEGINSGRKRAARIISYIGIGSNLGDGRRNCLEAIRRLGTVDGIAVRRRSSLYSTEPVGTGDDNWFVNAVAEVATDIGPRRLFDSLTTIEMQMGRPPAPRRGPRVIDLDLLLYGQMVVSEADLTVPHPALHTRRFVLIPLNEVAAYVIHPAFGISIQGLLDRLDDDSRVLRIEEQDEVDHH